MRLLFVFIIFSVVMEHLFAETWGGYSNSPKEVQHAMDFGADTKVIFTVTDDEGRPLKDVNVSAGFYLNREPGKNLSRRGQTDANGVFVAAQKSVGEVNYSAFQKRLLSNAWERRFLR